MHTHLRISSGLLALIFSPPGSIGKTEKELKISGLLLFQELFQKFRIQKFNEETMCR